MKTRVMPMQNKPRFSLYNDGMVSIYREKDRRSNFSAKINAMPATCVRKKQPAKMRVARSLLTKSGAIAKISDTRINIIISIVLIFNRG